MNICKLALVNIYNKFYDILLDGKPFFKWRRDLKVQQKYGLPKILSFDETLDKIQREKLSICRYGDGEFKIMDGDRILFQPENQGLANRLIEVIHSNEENVLVCIPSFFDRRRIKRPSGLNKDEKKRYIQAKKYMNNIIADRRLRWYEYFDMNRVYGEACISRFYAGVYDDEKSARWIAKWKEIWRDRNLLIIEGEQTRLGIGNDLFEDSMSIRRILCPAIGAFQAYDNILSTALNNYNKDDLVLIALGPTATVLAYDLSQKGIQALDVGHIDIEYEWYLRKDRTHQKIENKFVSEAEEFFEVAESNDEAYKQQILICVSL